MRRRQHDRRVHLLEESGALGEEFLPGWILHRVTAGFGAGVEVGIGPDVADFVWLPRLGLPEPDDLGVFFAFGQHRGEGLQPLPDRTDGPGAIIAQFVDIARGSRSY